MEYGEYLILASTLIGVGGVVATVMYARFRMQLLSKITFAMLAVVIVVVLVGFTLGKLGVTLMTMGISTFIGVGTLVIAISALNKSIARPLDRLIAVMDEVSRGNLDLEIDIQRRDDDLGELARSFRKMKESVAALLKEQEEATHFFEGTINSIADMVVTTDSEFRVNMVNPALEKLLGFREEEVVGKPVAELSFLPRERTANLGDILAELGRVGIRTSESELRHKDGGMIPFLTSMATMRDADGNALGMVVIAKDITEIKSLMRQQEEAARFFGGTINSIADMVVTTDSEFRVNMVNPALEKLLGFREEEVVGKPVAELPFFSKERASNLGDTLAELSRVGIRTTESELRRKDGRMIPFLTSMATMRDADGNVLGMVVVGKDITEIKNLMRQQEEQREYLERSAKQISAAMQEIAEGNLEIGLQKERDDEIGTIIDSIHGTVDEVKALVADVHTLAEAGVAGRLDARADASRHHGDFRKIVQGLNDTLDAIVGPFSATAEYVGRISRGDIPEPILDEYQGDFNEIKNNLNELISSLDKVTAVTTQIAAGDLAVEVRLRSERDELMKSLSEMATYLQEMADAAGRIAQGDLQVEVTPKSKKDILGSAFSQMITGLNATISQTNGVVEQVVPSVEQIRAISQSLASSAEEQSAAAEEVASSLEQTDAQVRSNAESANVANQLVSQASDVANAGQEKMKSMTKAMDGIAEASREI
ncbi:MAG: PAS domain S-box protein, partial [Chloroflexota bacterium]|nr:PAS domain S-box protein [Chloroflexota bacterium]